MKQALGALLLLLGCGEDPSRLSPETEAWLQQHRDPRTWQAISDETLEGLPRRVRDPRTSIEFVLVPAGEFEMGGTAPAEQPVHTVRITKPFYIGRTEVTNGQWRRWIAEHGGTATPPPADPADDHPVTGVSWHEARAFCATYGYSLPTEAQWEYACRGNATGNERFWEDPDDLDRHAWTGANSGGTTHPVGTREPNGFGIHDMLGNVWEWCETRYAEGYRAGAGVVDDPQGPETGVARVLRGGSWFSLPAPRPSDRGGDRPEVQNDFYGFRVIRAVDG